MTKRMKLDRLRHTVIFSKQGPLALHPHPDDAGIQRLYSISEAERLLARFTGKAGEATSSDMRRVREAARRALCMIDEVLELLADGKLEQVCFKPDDLFEGILVSIGELRTKTKEPYLGWIHPDEVAERLDINEEEAADLMRKATLPSEFVSYPGGIAMLTTKQALHEFDRRYLSLPAIAREQGKLPAALIRNLEKAGIAPAIKRRCGRPLFYYRHDLAT
jgi:hypothetical protein